jgi:hypothetical protein
LIEDNSILKDVRSALGVGEVTTDFDVELIMHINGALGTLNQNGVGLPVFVSDDTLTWANFRDPLQVKGNPLFPLVQSFVMLSVKLLFDPPPPSAVEHFRLTVDQLLWRLKIAYEPLVVSEPIVE